MVSEAKGKIGLILSGGGARGAYQAGVMKAVAEIAAEMRLLRPIPIVTGVSAGAVNAAFLAARADNFLEAAERMAVMWSTITANQIFKTDAFSAGRSGLRFFTDATFGALYRRKLARSLLDTTPLKKFLSESIAFDQVENQIRAGHIEALAVTAMNYSNATSTTFIQGGEQAKMWSRSRRFSKRSLITGEHVMASAAIPLFFPPVAVGDEHFGDGCLRNTAPLSPAIHLGEDRLLVISVRRPDKIIAENENVVFTKSIEPSLARILGVILNALLLDAVDLDMERMSRINSTIDFVPDYQRATLNLRKVEFLWIRPSRDIGELAGDLFDRLPSVLRYLIGGLGTSREASELTSYLLFDPDFCGRLVKMGYEDGQSSRDAIMNFLTDQ